MEDTLMLWQPFSQPHQRGAGLSGSSRARTQESVWTNNLLGEQADRETKTSS